ncbi:MAG: hypothetical protein DMG96_36770 [Acidobacteria bacterium]|nr:MAG: hypothetical protein DMG96_36770 [Acidobacteriota bacterium]
MASTATTTTDFVSLVAEEIVAGIDDATEYWLARVEQELTAANLSCVDRIEAVQRVLREYKEVTEKAHLRSASA